MVDRLELGAADPRVRKFVRPERIVWRRGDAKHLMGADTLLREGGKCVMRHDGGDAPALVLDFGRRLALGATRAVLDDPGVRRAYLGTT